MAAVGRVVGIDGGATLSLMFLLVVVVEPVEALTGDSPLALVSRGSLACGFVFAFELNVAGVRGTDRWLFAFALLASLGPAASVFFFGVSAE